MIGQICVNKIRGRSDSIFDCFDGVTGKGTNRITERSRKTKVRMFDEQRYARILKVSRRDAIWLVRRKYRSGHKFCRRIL